MNETFYIYILLKGIFNAMTISSSLVDDDSDEPKNPGVIKCVCVCEKILYYDNNNNDDIKIISQKTIRRLDFEGKKRNTYDY